MTRLGSVTNHYVGSDPVQKVMLGSNQVWPEETVSQETGTYSQAVLAGAP